MVIILTFLSWTFSKTEFTEQDLVIEKRKVKGLAKVEDEQKSQMFKVTAAEISEVKENGLSPKLKKKIFERWRRSFLKMQYLKLGLWVTLDLAIFVPVFISLHKKFNDFNEEKKILKDFFQGKQVDNSKLTILGFDASNIFRYVKDELRLEASSIDTSLNLFFRLIAICMAFPFFYFNQRIFDIFTELEISRPYNPFFEYMDRYLEVKFFISPSLQEKFELLLVKVNDLNIKGKLDMATVNDIEYKLEILEKLVANLAENEASKNNEIDSFKRFFGSKDFDSSFNAFSKEDLNFVADMMALHLAGKSIRSNFLFVGPPGTGKTLLVNLFAQKLGIRTFFLSLEGKSDVDILGSSWGQDGKSKLGELDQAFLEFEGKEGILVLDEGVKTINSSKMLTTVFLKLLESSETNYYSIFLDREIPISNVVMIILDNENFEDLALDQRVFKVEFNGYNLDQKYQVLIDKIIPRFKELLEFNFNLSAKDKAYLRQMLKAVKNEEGFRTIEKGVLSWIVEKKIFSKGIKKKKLNFPKVLKDQLKFNSQQYNSYVNSR